MPHILYCIVCIFGKKVFLVLNLCSSIFQRCYVWIDANTFLLQICRCKKNGIAKLPKQIRSLATHAWIDNVLGWKKNELFSLDRKICLHIKLLNFNARFKIQWQQKKYLKFDGSNISSYDVLRTRTNYVKLQIPKRYERNASVHLNR